ncbi:YfbK domain-containing protein [Cognatiyoonia sp. IB215182]|uniref:YfbK domain-containing protein n=1 Tax=Cognatiyoonia sp. IB215182 TaxID=3097353 RepID=UPI002A11E949|nr:von Willebrand factor type A domain-containing protein [Cognatiyoonia sp. IB215182]MDX8351580.1 von Willebrand factor type A domain-containing protein [Cognatiyoonia sp. IB215182]
MNDDLGDLKATFDAVTPQADAARRAENLALAERNFRDLQRVQSQERPKSARPLKQFSTGIRAALTSLSSKKALTTTTAVIAGGFLLIMPQMQDSISLPPSPQITTLDFDGEVTEPQIESGPMLTDDLTPDLLQREPLTEPFGEVLRGPVVEPPELQADKPERFAPEGDDQLGDGVPMRFATTSADMAVPENEALASLSATDLGQSSYALVRAALMRGELPPPDAVHVAEMVSHFAADSIVIDTTGPVTGPIIRTIQTPWNANTSLVHITVQGREESLGVNTLAGESSDNIRLEVMFNPVQVAAFGRVGDDMRSLDDSDRVGAASFDAEQGISVLYEISPGVGRLIETGAGQPDPLGQVVLHFRVPDGDRDHEIETPIIGQSRSNTDAFFAAAVAGFALLLREDPSVAGWSYDEAISLAEANRGADPFGHRTEALQLMRLAQGLAE